jgi:hypothetical protein
LPFLAENSDNESAVFMDFNFSFEMEIYEKQQTISSDPLET